MTQQSLLSGNLSTEEFLFAHSRDAVDDSSAPSSGPTERWSCFYSLIREMRSMTLTVADDATFVVQVSIRSFARCGR